MRELRDIADRLCRSEDPSVLATLVTVDGSSYRRPGARMLIAPGTRMGSISGGCLEEDLVERARKVASSGRPELVVYDTTRENDLVWGVGLGCHGVVRVLLEALPPRPGWAAVLSRNLESGKATDIEVVWKDSRVLGTRLAAGQPGSEGVFSELVGPPSCLSIFGAGDDARPLAHLAADLGWRVTVADPRPALLTPGRFPGAATLVLGPAEELAARAAPGKGSLAVVMTHHYRHDLPLMRHLLPLPLAYLGLLGPRRRAEKIIADLEAGGLRVTAAMRRRLRAPVGLDLGADGPDEIALSIISEMAAVRTGRSARPLRSRLRPIHA